MGLIRAQYAEIRFLRVTKEFFAHEYITAKQRGNQKQKTLEVFHPPTTN